MSHDGERLFFAVPRGCLRFVIVVFPDHTHYFYDVGIMFMGSVPFRGMLGSCRREGMCMLTIISEKDKLIMLIKPAPHTETKL